MSANQPPPSNATKTCPFCQMTDVPAKASRCPHCAGDIGKHEMLNSKVCFVATAVLGDEDHPDVQVLRQFRDVYLLRSRSGRALVRGYYAVGPYLASAIANSRTLRRGAHFLCVRPIANLARRTLARA